MNVLVPVQRGHDIQWISNYLADLRRNSPSLCAYVLSVQPQYDGCVRMFFSRPQLHAILCADARAQSADLRQALASRGIRYRMLMAVGNTAEQIAQLARERCCRHVVMGPKKRFDLGEFLFGSLRRDVEYLIRGDGLGCTVL